MEKIKSTSKTKESNEQRRQSIKKIFRTCLTFVLVLVFTCTLSACAKSPEYVKKFSTAIAARDYDLADNIYKQAELAEYPAEEFIAAADREIEAVVADFSSAKISYDQTIMQLEALHLGKNFRPVIADKIKDAKKRVQNVDELEIILANAKIYADSEEYTKSLDLYKEAKKLSPDDPAIDETYQEVLQKYLAGVQTEVESLLKTGYPLTAQELINRADEYASNDEKITALRQETQKKDY